MKYYIVIEANNCPCCGTFFPCRELSLPDDVLIQILDNVVLGTKPLLLSKRLGQTLYPRLYSQLVRLYNPQSETYLLSDLTHYEGAFPSLDQWVVEKK